MPSEMGSQLGTNFANLTHEGLIDLLLFPSNPLPLTFSSFCPVLSTQIAKCLKITAKELILEDEASFLYRLQVNEHKTFESFH